MLCRDSPHDNTKSRATLLQYSIPVIHRPLPIIKESLFSYQENGEQQQLHTVSLKLRLYCTVIGLIKSTTTSVTPTPSHLQKINWWRFARVEIREIRNKIIAHANKKGSCSKSTVVLSVGGGDGSVWETRKVFPQNVVLYILLRLCA